MHVQLSVYGNKREAEVRRQLSSKGGNEAVMEMQFFYYLFFTTEGERVNGCVRRDQWAHRSLHQNQMIDQLTAR